MAAEFYLAHGEFSGGIAAIEDDSEAGRQLRRRLGESLTRDVGRMFRTAGLQLGYRYEGSPICIADGTPPLSDDPEKLIALSASRKPCAPRVAADGRSTLDLFGRGFVLHAVGRRADGCT